MQNFSTPLLVVAAALVDSDGSVVMRRRPSHSVHGDLWEFPGGKVEPGESPESALVREISEELGISIRESDLDPLAFASGKTAGEGPPRVLVILLYMCRHWQGEPHCQEGGVISRFDPQTLAALDMPPLDYPLAAHLAAAAANNCL